MDGRTSRDYRKERFEALLMKTETSHDGEYLDQLADLYQHALSQCVWLKPGAIDLLNPLKSMQKKIIIITEELEDTQLRTLQHLGISDKIDCLARTNRFGVSKIDGLLVKVMEKLQIDAEDIVVIGDSLERNVAAAVNASVFAIHFDDDSEGGKNGLVEATPVTSVISLEEIRVFLGEELGSSI